MCKKKPHRYPFLQNLHLWDVKIPMHSRLDYFYKEHWTKNLTYPIEKKYLKRIFWLSISLSSQISDINYSICLQSRQRKMCDILLEEGSECIDYYCNSCQCRSRNWTSGIKINNLMCIVPLPPLLYIPLFLVCFYIVWAHLSSPFWAFYNIKLPNLPKIIPMKNPV